MSQTDINRAVRQTHRSRSLGTAAKCDECGSTDVVSLVKTTAGRRPTTRTRTKRTSTKAKTDGGSAPSPTNTKASGPASQTNAPPRVLCYEDLLLQQGKATIEAHHLLGNANDPSTVGVAGNLHRALTDSQEDWPEESRRNRH